MKSADFYRSLNLCIGSALSSILVDTKRKKVSPETRNVLKLMATYP